MQIVFLKACGLGDLGIFEVVFIFEAVFILEDVFILKVVFTFDVSSFLRLS